MFWLHLESESQLGRILWLEPCVLISMNLSCPWGINPIRFLASSDDEITDPKQMKCIIQDPLKWAPSSFNLSTELIRNVRRSLFSYQSTIRPQEKASFSFTSSSHDRKSRPITYLLICMRISRVCWVDTEAKNVHLKVAWLRLPKQQICHNPRSHYHTWNFDTWKCASSLGFEIESVCARSMFNIETCSERM